MERKQACPERGLRKTRHPGLYMNATDQKTLARIIDRHYPEFLAYMAEQGKPLLLNRIQN